MSARDNKYGIKVSAVLRKVSRVAMSEVRSKGNGQESKIKIQ
jgi:hypothetical protein